MTFTNLGPSVTHGPNGAIPTGISGGGGGGGVTVQSGTAAARPAPASAVQVIYYATDTLELSYSDGTTWSTWAKAVVLSGTAAARPAAASAPQSIYYATDTGALSYSNGATWTTWINASSTSVQSGTAAARPAAAAAVRVIYYATDTLQLSYSDGVTWSTWAKAVVLSGTAAARPAFAAAPQTIYYATDTLAVSYSDGASWTTWAKANVQSGTAAARPAAAAAPSTIYYATDTLALSYSDGATWTTWAKAVVSSGTAAARPAAAAAPQTIYYATDTGAISYSDGATWTVFLTSTPVYASVLTAKGQLVGASASATPSAVPALSTPGTALVLDAAAAANFAGGTPRSLWVASQGPSVSLGETIPRTIVGTAGAALLTSGTLFLAAVGLPKGLTVTSISFEAITGGSAPTHQQFGLFDSSRVGLRVSGDDTSTAWGNNTIKTLSLSSTYLTTYEGLHYLMVLWIGGTPPTLLRLTLSNANLALVPLLAGNTTDSGLTGIVTLPFTAGAITAASVPYAYVS